jgi:hypothetical protein
VSTEPAEVLLDASSADDVLVGGSATDPTRTAKAATASSQPRATDRTSRKASSIGRLSRARWGGEVLVSGRVAAPRSRAPAGTR